MNNEHRAGELRKIRGLLHTPPVHRSQLRPIDPRVTALSRAAVLSFNRARYSRAAFFPAEVRVKNSSAFGSLNVMTARKTVVIVMRVMAVSPGPPAGPDPARMSRSISSGARSAIAWATMPPIDRPNTSTRSCPRAWIIATISSAMSSIESRMRPVESPTPRYPTAIT